ncbi:MAG: pilus assembly protein CpaE [Rhodospirillaceae bacterium]|jgi:pilus assembly protein CpaE|nr:pilus assembly protein CpaE [Rhodospirillaceae bacterium]
MNAQVARLTASSDAAPPFMAFAADEATRAVMAEAAEALGYGGAAVVAGDVALAATSLAEIPTPEVLVIDLDSDVPPTLAVEHLATVCDPGAHVVFVGSVNDVTLYRDLKAAGVADYLVKPLSVEGLIEALHKPEPAEIQVLDDAAQPDGARIGVVGARGGAGATTIATSLAWILSEERRLRTALADLDVTYGTIALNLDLEPNRGLADAMENPARVDDLFIERATLTVSERLAVLASEADPAESPVAVDAQARLADHLHQTFAVVVLDLPRHRLAKGGTVGSLDRLVIVTEPTLAGLRDAVRVKTLALAGGLSENAVHVVVNRVGLLAKGELDAKTMSGGGQLRISHMLPFDAKAASAAMTQGKPLYVVAAKSKIGKALRELSQDLVPVDDDAPKSAFARWFRGGK